MQGDTLSCYHHKQYFNILGRSVERDSKKGPLKKVAERVAATSKEFVFTYFLDSCDFKFAGTSEDNGIFERLRFHFNARMCGEKTIY